VFLISDLLDLSRIEAGRLEVRAERVELAELFEDMRRFIEPRLVGRNITFRAVLQDGASVTADRNRLEQILTNLLSNAAKFTERGYIELRARRNATAGNVEIEVTDTGVGISPQEAATLFEPFRQGEAGKRAGGVGVGLSLSARLATAMGGGLSLTSELGRGSTFLLRLPE
jgi:signal transduction histidine kinase